MTKKHERGETGRKFSVIDGGVPDDAEYPHLQVAEPATVSDWSERTDTVVVDATDRFRGSSDSLNIVTALIAFAQSQHPDGEVDLKSLLKERDHRDGDLEPPTTIA